MRVSAATAPILAEAARRRAEEVVGALSALGPTGLEAPSTLPGWTRLTIACHLRYGASALGRMTTEALAGQATTFYPEGRSTQRPGTLVTEPGETGRDVVRSLQVESEKLHDSWSSLAVEAWETVVEEPAQNVDLGPTTLGLLALLRLTEVEVHGTDLDLGLDDWSDVFVTQALAVRLEWLMTRRSNHRDVDTGIDGSWLLVVRDGDATLVTARGQQVTVEVVERSRAADAVIEGSGRDLLALLLGRPPRHGLEIRGDQQWGRAFERAFPGP